MRRIVAAVRSLIDRLPANIDILTFAGWLGVGLWINLYDTRLAFGWYAVSMFVIGLLLEVDAYRRSRSR